MNNYGLNAFEPINLRVNYTCPEYAAADTPNPVFSWGAGGRRQAAYRITVIFDGGVLWDSGFIKSRDPVSVYAGKPLPSGALAEWNLQLKDSEGNLSRAVKSYFKTACFDGLCGDWIESPYEKEREVQYFSRRVTLYEKPHRAVLYYAGIGLSKAFINGKETDAYRLQPLHSNYAKICYYVTSVLDTADFAVGENEISIAVAGGWRTNYGEYLNNLSENRKILFMGKKCLWGMLVLYYRDGRKDVICTNSEWQCTTGNIVSSHLFDGETYDENADIPPKKPAIISDFKPKKLYPQYLEPVCVKRRIYPKISYFVNGRTVYDFGENFAGVLRIHVKGTCRNVRFILRHSEEVMQNGDLFRDTLRGARAEDVLIVCDGDRDLEFSPQFTYHGFRFASLETEGEFDGETEVSALNFYTDIDTEGFFKCGNQTVTEYYNAAVRTERANIHSTATDCPQRDERMAWMNDASVRFMSMPYNFNCARLFEKIADDIRSEQSPDGALTCTAPFVYGERPADPVCCAYLVAAMEHYKMTGDTRVIKKHYGNFAAWCNFLLRHAPDGIVDYSYYGDWAGPEDSCFCVDTIGNSESERLEGYEPGAANSRYIPGKMISTAVFYMTLCLTSEFAEILTGKGSFAEEKTRVKTAFLNKWFDKKTAAVGTGSQGEQALALYTGLIPEKYRSKAAKVMAEAVLTDGCRIKTGNIVTPMLLDMLSEYGYKDIAWKILTRTEYPSFGYMLENGATTLWERFELKEDAGMNSHNHPMYGASAGWLYRHLAGFKVTVPNREYVLSPDIPADLPYFEMLIPLMCGNIYLKCEKKYGKLTVFTDIPFSADVYLDICKKRYKLQNGFSTNSFTFDEKTGSAVHERLN